MNFEHCFSNSRFLDRHPMAISRFHPGHLFDFCEKKKRLPSKFFLFLKKDIWCYKVLHLGVGTGQHRWAMIGWAPLGWAPLGWALLGWAPLGWAPFGRAVLKRTFGATRCSIWGLALVSTVGQ